MSLTRRRRRPRPYTSTRTVVASLVLTAFCLAREFTRRTFGLPATPAAA